LEAAQLYRSWAIQQSWHVRPAAEKRKTQMRSLDAARDEAVLSQQEMAGIWLVGRGAGQQVMANALALQRELNAPVRLLWQWWHSCPGEAHYPDYLPPREGDPEIARVLKLLAGAGIPAWLAMNGAMASPNSQTWDNKNLDQLASRDRTGALQEKRQHTFINDTLAAMCPIDDKWPALLGDICRRMHGLGAAGAWLEEILPTGEGLRCFAPTHDHEPGGGAFLNSLDSFACALSAADPPELYLRYLSAVVLSGVSCERMGRPRHVRGDAWEPAPLFQAVYAPHLSAVGLIGPLNNAFPVDPLWSEEGRMRSADMHLLHEEYAAQFCLESARTLLWGSQPGLWGFDMASLREQPALRKLAFVRMLLQVNAAENTLARGEFLGMIPVSCPTIEADFLVNPLYAAAGQRRAYTRTVPAVMASAWQGGGGTPGQGKPLLILVNLTENPVDFACELPLARLGLVDLRRAYGLTFTPGAGSKPASLALSGAEVSGRLPGHSACIVWL
jgi:hypothetical protein